MLKGVKTYIYETEDDYYKEYQNSVFAQTKKKLVGIVYVIMK